MTTPPLAPGVERALRELAPQVLGILVRRCGDFAAAEDAVQEALVAAATRWPGEGTPDDPRAWLVRVASRRLVDQVRAEAARRRREARVDSLIPPDEKVASAPDQALESPADDTLPLLFMCCHPVLSPASAIALTLRALGGLTTAEIARAFFVPEATMAQRISRARQTIQDSGARLEMPVPADATQRLDRVLHVLYLMFSEGYTASAGPDLQRPDLASEALRLTRTLHRQLPTDPEVAGLLALMLLTEARRAARTDPAGALIPLDEQERSLWNRAQIGEGVALLTAALARGRVGAYQLQAAVAAVHDEAARVEDTDWPQILALYGLLQRISDNPMVALNQAVAVAMVHGTAAGLQRLEALSRDPRLAQHHRLDAVRAHLLERAGDRVAASDHYRRAAARTTSLPEREYLLTRAARLGERGG